MQLSPEDWHSEKAMSQRLIFEQRYKQNECWKKNTTPLI